MDKVCYKCGKNKAIYHPTYGYLQCAKCRDKDRKRVGEIKPLPEFYTLSMTDRITGQRLKYEKDIIQPYRDGANPDPDFVKAYPELARSYFTQEQLEKL